jgi:predicted ABC-type ATPase
MLLNEGTRYFNPDEAAIRIREIAPGMSLENAQAAAWKEGRRLLERAITERLDFAFETTLGGNTIPALLEEAARAGIEVRIWYVGLASPELHIERVRARVASGGHDIPEGKIRERYTQSRLNLIRLLPHLSELRLYDNSLQGDPKTGKAPQPCLLLHWKSGHIASLGDHTSIPDWAKPVLSAAMQAT